MPIRSDESPHDINCSLRTKEFAVSHIAVSIVTFRTTSCELAQCIMAVLKSFKFLCASTTGGMRCSIQIVNNGFTDTTEAENSFNENNSLRCNLSVLSGHGNIGYGAAQNMAFGLEDSKYHVFMNPDVRVHEDSLAEGLAYLEKYDDAVALSPTCSDGEGKQFLCKRYPSVFDLALRGFLPRPLQKTFKTRLDHYEMRDIPEGAPYPGVPLVSGCFIMCRSETLRHIGGFDPTYFLYFEDFDLSIRLSRYGKLVYLPSMRIIHTGGEAAKKGVRHIMMFLRSAFRFFMTHGWKFY